jgi:hypothetical protein
VLEVPEGDSDDARSRAEAHRTSSRGHLSSTKGSRPGRARRGVRASAIMCFAPLLRTR